jgi:DHA1 family bicyclomycin/chloramphenicol resistance-like MFS transporter
VISAISTVGAVFLAAPVGLLFDGTPTPLAIAIFLEAAAGLALMRLMMHRDTAKVA